jgi:serine protease Do
MEDLMRWLGATGWVCVIALVAAQPRAEETSESYADLVTRVVPSVVNISVKKMIPDGSGPTAPTSEKEFFGSGFVIDPSGYILTNRHVVIDSFAVTVVFSDGMRLPTHVIGHPPATDFALLKVDTDHPLPAVTFGDSDLVRVGERVLAIGNPLGLSGTVTLGIVSALNRDTGDTPYDNFIQTDAAINHGNSGGPLFDMKGEVIGVNTALIATGDAGAGSMGLGLAIPANDAKFAASELRAFGRVRPGWIGARLQQVTPDLAAALGLTKTDAIIVAGVDSGSPADAAGLRQGDLVERFGDQSPHDVRALMRMIAEYPLEHNAPLTVRRDKDDATLTMTVKEYPPAKMVADYPFELTSKRTMRMGDLGLSTAPLTPTVRARLNMAQDAQAVEVSAVPPGSAADGIGLRVGDAILQVQNQPASSPDIVLRELQLAATDYRGQLALLVLDQDGPRWVALPVPPTGSR